MREREQRQRNVKKYLLYLYYNKSYLVVRPLSTKKKKNKIMGGGGGEEECILIDNTPEKGNSGWNFTPRVLCLLVIAT